MQVRILGSAAGGGVPQWNCRCPNCAAARAGSPEVRPRTQSSVAVSADGWAWFLLNVSPDVRQQVLAFPPLGPRMDAVRDTAIAGCVLTDSELDHTAGLLLLREGGMVTKHCNIDELYRRGCEVLYHEHPISIHCTATVRRWLNSSLPIEPVLASFSLGGPSTIRWNELPLDVPVDLCLQHGAPSGLRIHAFEMDRHVPRFVKEEAASAVGSVIGLEVEDLRTGGRLVYAPCVATLRDSLVDAVREADCLLLDGTFWDDDELNRSGIGGRTAREMGHLPVSGPEGSLAWLADLPARHRVYVHINNTNPMLNERGPEHRQVTDSGVRVGADGEMFDL